MGQRQGTCVRSLFLPALCVLLLCVGCSSKEETPAQTAVLEEEEAPAAEAAESTGWQGMSARDGSLDFEKMRQLNPEIFAWIDVPGTRIDEPVCQAVDDTKYETYNALGVDDGTGAVYTEMANLRDMCDFNEVLHASSASAFGDLEHFLEPSFFDEHRTAIVYLEDNRLTYEIFAAYRRENTSLIRDYDFTEESGCTQFLSDLMRTRDMSTQFRTGYEDVNAYNFLLTLTAHEGGTASNGQGDQIVVLAVLTADEAGTIDRDMNPQELYYDALEGDGTLPLEE